MPLKPQNVIQAAGADLARSRRNADEAATDHPSYEQYAFHRKHVRRADDASHLVRLALMDPTVANNTIKKNTKLIYGDAALLLAAIRSTTGERACSMAKHPNGVATSTSICPK